MKRYLRFFLIALATVLGLVVGLWFTGYMMLYGGYDCRDALRFSDGRVIFGSSASKAELMDFLQDPGRAQIHICDWPMGTFAVSSSTFTWTLLILNIIPALTFSIFAYVLTKIRQRA